MMQLTKDNTANKEREQMKITERENITNLPYSLHDMRVNAMERKGDNLIMRFEGGYLKLGEACEQVGGYIEFEKVDFDFCFVYVLDICANEGDFIGHKYLLADFIKHKDCGSLADSTIYNAPFEIVGETYGYNTSVFEGYLYVGEGIRECVIDVYHFGAMRYVAEK
ncbi:MAG: hypothetical protein GX061_02695 [Eubacteriaceae bacterium]|nr:hypothetical protein [Eubacteriaceae bacterium]